MTGAPAFQVIPVPLLRVPPPPIRPKRPTIH